MTGLFFPPAALLHALTLRAYHPSAGTGGFLLAALPLDPVLTNPPFGRRRP